MISLIIGIEIFSGMIAFFFAMNMYSPRYTRVDSFKEWLYFFVASTIFNHVLGGLFIGAIFLIKSGLIEMGFKN